MTADLKIISQTISGEPFNKKWSIIQLHDELTPDQLLQATFEVAAYIDEANKNCAFLQESKEFQERVYRLVDFLRMLKWSGATNPADLYIFSINYLVIFLLTRSLG
jgi:intraflagellar transport protein 81